MKAFSLYFSLFLILISYQSKGQLNPNIPIGSWRDHLSYNQAKRVALIEDRVLVATQSALFFYDKEDKSIERFSKVNGLSDAEIINVAYDKQTKSIVVIYNNSNIDIIQKGKVYNIPDIKNRTIEGSKMINNITFDSKKAYLSCGFGIVVLNLAKNEISDTYYIGHNNSALKVNNVAINDSCIFAATINGMKYAPKNSNLLAISENWIKVQNITDTVYSSATSSKTDSTKITESTIIPPADTSYKFDTILKDDFLKFITTTTISSPKVHNDTVLVLTTTKISDTTIVYDISNNEVYDILKFNNEIISSLYTFYNKANSLFFLKNNGWIKDSVLINRYITMLRSTDDYFIMGSWGGGSIFIDFFDKDFKRVSFIDDNYNPIMHDNSNSKISTSMEDVTVDSQKNIWLAHSYGGLLHLSSLDDRRTTPIIPNGPVSNELHSIKASKDGVIYIAPGRIENDLKADLYTFDGFYWKSLDLNGYDNLINIINIAIDPRNSNRIMACSWKNGVIEIDAKNNKVVNVFNDENTISSEYPDGAINATYFGSSRVGVLTKGIDYDEAGNLIIANTMVKSGLSYLNYHGAWGNFNTGDYFYGDKKTGLLLDKTNFYKLMWNGENKILLLNNNGDKVLIDPNNGAKDNSNVINCMVQDKNGEIWIGTDKGIKVIYSLDNVYETSDGKTSKVTCNNIIYEKDDIAQYLLNFDNINCIIIDGANNKWIGTDRNGVFVYSPNGSKQLYHFTAENSPLFSNQIMGLAQNAKTGEVYIGTNRGLISYKAESTEGAETAGKLTAYPNPVKPEYNGVIAIKGFVSDSDVKITDINGKLIAHLKSNGGQAIWNGKDFKGQRVPTGVYLIFGSAKEGKENASGKILFIR